MPSHCWSPLPLCLAIEHVREAYAVSGFVAAQSAVSQENLARIRNRLRLESESGKTAGNALYAYLYEWFYEIGPYSTIRSVVPFIVVIIAREPLLSEIAQFARCVLWGDWDDWASTQREALRTFFEALWCERVKSADLSGIEAIVEASPLGLDVQRIFGWWNRQTERDCQALVARFVLRRMDNLCSRTPYWRNGEPEVADAIERVGMEMTNWLLSPAVLESLETAWLADGGDDSGDLPAALEFLYSLSETTNEGARQQ